MKIYVIIPSNFEWSEEQGAMMPQGFTRPRESYRNRALAMEKQTELERRARLRNNPFEYQGPFDSSSAEDVNEVLRRHGTAEVEFVDAIRDAWEGYSDDVKLDLYEISDLGNEWFYEVHELEVGDCQVLSEVAR